MVRKTAKKTRPRITPKVLVQRDKTRVGEHKLLFLQSHPETNLRVQESPAAKLPEPMPPRLRRRTVLVRKRVKAAEDSTPANAMPRTAHLGDRIPDDDASRQSTNGLPVRLAVAIPEKDEIQSRSIANIQSRPYRIPCGAIQIICSPMYRRI